MNNKKIYIIVLLTIVNIFMVSCGNSKSENIKSDKSSITSQTNSEISNSNTSENQSESISETEIISQEIATQEPTKEIFDVTKAYKNKPYTDDFAISRVDELQYIDDDSLYYLSSSEPSPIFYEYFYREKGEFDVNLEQYNYGLENETVRKYFDTYEYSKLASAGAVKVIDSFVYKDTDRNRTLYYCYYTVTHWSENESNDTMDYYRDLITINNKDKTITLQEKIPIRKNLKIPKEISGEHDFHNVI